jgi:hypothetical protein
VDLAWSDLTLHNGGDGICFMRKQGADVTATLSQITTDAAEKSGQAKATEMLFTQGDKKSVHVNQDLLLSLSNPSGSGVWTLDSKI